MKYQTSLSIKNPCLQSISYLKMAFPALPLIKRLQNPFLSTAAAPAPVHYQVLLIYKFGKVFDLFILIS